MRIVIPLIAGALGALIALGGWLMVAPPETASPSPRPEAAPQRLSDDAPYRSVTSHETVIGGETIAYKAVSGDTFLYNGAGEPIGSIFSFSYFRTDIGDASDRPVLFIFNGGPGSASLWLHMGAVGPRRVALDNEVNPKNIPPFGVVDNPYSVLDVADLVFIDPVGTGFSRVIGKGTTADFWGVDEDADSVAQFIELWLSEYGRWNSPKFIMGESYGSVRAAVLPRALMGSPLYAGVMRGITVNGVVLLGTTLENMGQGGEGDRPDRLLRQALALPAIAATAWVHGRSDMQADTIEDVNEKALAYAKGPYVEALEALEAGSLSDEQRKDVVAKLAGFTGLAAEDIPENLVLSERAYVKTILKDEGLEAGMYDSRYTLPLDNSGGDPVADDPAMGRYVPSFVAAFHQMLRDDLKVDVDRPYYAIRWKDLLSSWNWKRQGPVQPPSYAAELAWAMRRNEDMRVLVASGYYDLVTTPADAVQSIADAKLPEDRVRFENYESGHMLYLGDTAEAFADDVRALIVSASNAKQD